MAVSATEQAGTHKHSTEGESKIQEATTWAAFHWPESQAGSGPLERDSHGYFQILKSLILIN